MTDTFWWHERDDGSAAGPFTEEHIRRMLEEGALAAGARIWSSRQQPWPPQPPARVRRRLSMSRRAAGWIALWAVSLLGWLLFAFAIGLVQTHGVSAQLRADPWLWPRTGLLLPAAALALGALWWLAPSRLGAGPELTSGTRIAASLIVTAWLIPSGMLLRDSALTVREAEATRDWDSLMSPGPDPNTLVVQGAIGVDFASRLSDRLAALPDPARIIIESPGGLVDQALAAAKAIEQRRATVVVGGECASACTIVLMGGARRLAPYRGSLLFHAPSPVVASSNALANWLAGQEGDRGRAYLLSRGVPAADVDEAVRRGPQQIFAVQDWTALKQGVLTGLYDDRGDIDRDLALRLGPPKPLAPLGLLLPAALRALLPVRQRRAAALERAPLPAGQLELAVVLAVEQDQAAGVAVERAGLGPVDQEQGLGAVRVVAAGGEEHRLARSVGFRLQSVRQEALVAIAPQPAVQMLQPVRRGGAHDGPPAALQGLLQKLRQGLVEPGALQVVEPDLAGSGPGHQSS